MIEVWDFWPESLPTLLESIVFWSETFGESLWIGTLLLFCSIVANSNLEDFFCFSSCFLPTTSSFSSLTFFVYKCFSVKVGGKISSSLAQASFHVWAVTGSRDFKSLTNSLGGICVFNGATLGGIGFLVILIGFFFGLLEPGARTCTVPPRRVLPWIYENSGLFPPEWGLMLKVFIY